jgi:NADH-quinone oxidoreductase subunit C
MDEALNEFGEYIATALSQEVTGFAIANEELTVHGRADQIIKILSFLRDDSACHFKVLIDLCGVDYPDRPRRFDVVYHLLSLRHNQRIRVKVEADDETPIPSVCEVYTSAGWHEREAWDMFGILFAGNADLRRILTDYGFEGHPLRKDFPLTGFVEVRYDDELKRVAYEPVSLTQEFRRFDFMSPWEGAKYILPGDDKAADNENDGSITDGKD